LLFLVLGVPHPIDKEQEKLLKALGARVKSIREEKGLSLQDVAHSIGKDRQSVHSLEKGKFNPSLLYLIEICKGLEIDLEELIRGLYK
jgi:putative transcriptional regulator